MIRKYKRKRKTKVRFHSFEGMKCQGKKELRFLKECVRYHWPLPTKAKRVETPLGFYTPDFEYPDRYIEVKSLHTFWVCLGKEGFKGIDAPSDLQWKKINWTAKNVKPVHMVVYVGRDEYKPELSIKMEENIVIQFKGGRTRKRKVC